MTGVAGDAGAIRARSLRAALDIGRALGPSRVVDDPDALARFASDESEAEPCLPAAAILPHDAAEAAAAIAAAARHGAWVTPRAGGTGKSGGAIPAAGGLVVACDHLKAIKEIHEGDMVAVVEPGVVLADLHREVEARGLFYPPDPASLDSCCLGGNVAENAGGPRAFKYGVTSHYLLGLDVAMPTGGVLGFGHRPVKGVAGYDLAALFAGSEGTLGFFTGMTLRLLPRPPHVSAALALWDGAPAAGRGIGAVLAAGIVPRVMEIMDRECIETMREAGSPLPGGIGALVIMEFDGSEAAVGHDLERAGEAMTAAGAGEVLVAAGPAEQASLWRARRGISDALKKKWAHKIADDVAVPRGRLVEAIARIEEIGARHGIASATYGHAGDGNLHVNYLWSDPALCGAGEGARAETMRMAVDMGGTISGEHGIGLTKRRFLAMELGEGIMDLSRRLRAAIDPGGIMNPGKMFQEVSS